MTVEIKYKKKPGAKPGNQNAKEEVIRDKACNIRMYSALHTEMKELLSKKNEGLRGRKKISASKFICQAISEKITRDLEKIKPMNSNSSEKDKE